MLMTTVLISTAGHPQAVFFAGQRVLEREAVFTRRLHNHTAFGLRRRISLRGPPGASVPIRLMEPAG